MDLSLLRTFLAIYRARSLTAAAREIGLSQPTVTAQLRALEERLDQQLFHRLPRGVTPTTVADELAVEVAPHLDALAAITERSPAARDPFARSLHFAGPAELMCTRVVPTLASLIDQGLKLRVSLGLSDELLTGLTEARFDLVLSTVRPRGRAITAAPLTDEEFILVAAPRWADTIDRRRLVEEGPAVLRNVPLVSYAEDLPIIRRYWRTVFATRPLGSAIVVVPD
ncbi:LysR family transcriptional regulator, partial [Streptomyces sp. WAC02707]|uniref:LysR family transcriptional regulator n=1 Tax=Streptomyces sp. WAC02707 TaxID=2487417 RepID=UPI000F92D2E5